MRRAVFFSYGVLSHLLFFGVYALMAAFVGNLVIRKSIDSPPGGGLAALGIDLLLLSLFAVPHSVMARPGFKEVWTRLIPKEIERSTYVLVSNILVLVMIWQWRSDTTIIWDVQQPLVRNLLWALFAAGWFMVPAVSLMINHFDLFGTRQVWLFLKGKEYQSLPFRTPMFYRRMRHPLYVGWAIAFWATPTMTLGHLLFAAVLSLYMAIAVHYEERDLVDHFGDHYRQYQQRVPKYLPIARSGPVSLSTPTTRDQRVASNS